MLAWGCGSAERPTTASPPTAGQSGAGTLAGAAGSNATGGAAGASTSAGGGGSGGSFGVVLGDTPGEACIAYALAVCSRREECLGRAGANCVGATLGCPDLTFSPGATRTVEGLKACAQTYATLPCDQANTDVLPPCVTPGTKARGEECRYSSQCAGLSCSGGSECGTCGVLAHAGESCAEADVECASGTSCDTVTGKCLASTPVVQTPPGANEACTPGTSCVQDYYCQADGSGGGKCVPHAKATESCATLPCIRGTYCATNQTCTVVPGVNQPCGLDRFGSLYCSTDSVCRAAADNMSGTCIAPPMMGEPCLLPNLEPTTGGYCGGKGLHCDHSTTPPLCQPPGKPGAQCISLAECAGFASCECADPMVDCATKHCVELRVANQACTDPNTRCHPAFECTAGTCKPIALRGDFTAACGP